MGYELRREVRAVLPPGVLTPLERNLVLEIADQCGDNTREGFPGAALLALLIDKSERTVEETLKGIGKKWVELRVELGKGSDGRPYYSHRKVRTTFRFPDVDVLRAIYEKATGFPWASSVHATLPGATRKATKNPGASSEKPPTFSEKAPDFSEESPRESRGPFPQGVSSKNTSNPSPLPPTDTNAPIGPTPEEGGKGEFDSDQEQRINTLVAEILTLRPNDRRWTDQKIRDAINTCLVDGKPLNEIERAFPACATDPDTGSPGRLPLDFYWWALPEPQPFCGRCQDTGRIPGHSQYGDTATDRPCPNCTPLTSEMRGEFIRGLAAYPPCEHGIAGGNVAMPDYGWMYCATCRNESGYLQLDEQPRSSQRGGYEAQRVNLPAGARTAGWDARFAAASTQHVAYLDPDDLSVYDQPL